MKQVGGQLCLRFVRTDFVCKYYSRKFRSWPVFAREGPPVTNRITPNWSPTRDCVCSVHEITLEALVLKRLIGNCSKGRYLRNGPIGGYPELCFQARRLCERFFNSSSDFNSMISLRNRDLQWTLQFFFIILMAWKTSTHVRTSRIVFLSLFRIYPCFIQRKKKMYVFLNSCIRFYIYSAYEYALVAG